MQDLEWDGDLWRQDWKPRVQILACFDDQIPSFQIEVLKACLERMNWHRQQRAGDYHSPHYTVGSLLYEAACALYKRKLPFSQDDICEILNLSSHACGHGCDVTPPFEIALAYARKNGVTSELLSAVKVFMNSLKGVASSQVSHLKRKAGLLLILDAESESGKKACWSDRFRAGLMTIPADEQAKWRQLVLEMHVNDVQFVPKAWKAQATKFLESLGQSLVLERLSAWWPDSHEKPVWPIQTGGSHLLKYFIWLLGLIAPAQALNSQRTELVSRLSLLDWKPRERAQKVMIAAATYLIEFPPEVSWEALRRIGAWSSLSPDDAKGGKIPELIHAYAAKHKVATP